MVIPRGPQETVQQAAAACRRAWEAGVRRQRIDLLLPLIGATDLDDWPGGIRQQFKVRAPTGRCHVGTHAGCCSIPWPASARPTRKQTPNKRRCFIPTAAAPCPSPPPAC